MQQPVQDGRGNDSVPKEFAPFAEGAKLVRIGDGRSLRPRLTWISYNTATLPPTLAPFAQGPFC